MAKNTLKVVVVGDIKDAQRALGDLAKGTEQAGSRMEKVGKKLGKIGNDLGRKVTLPLAAVGAASVKTFADFDDAMTQSVAIMGDLDAAMRTTMEDTARDVAKTTTFSAKEAADSYFFLASAGLDAEASIAALPKVAQFAQAGMFDMALATDLLTDAQSALGLSIRGDAVANMENMVRVSDVLVGANTLANASVQQFSEALTNGAGAALRTVNKSMEEGVAVLAAFADQGVKGAAAGEQLAIILRDVSRAAEANSSEFAHFGIQVFDAEGNLRNLADIVAEFERVLGPMSDAQRAATFDTLGLTRSVGVSIRTLMGTSDAIRRYEGELRTMGGTTEEVADKQLESFTAQMGLAKSQLQDAAITIGSELAPKLLELTQGLGRAADGFAALDGSTQRALIGLGLLAAAASPLVKIAGLFVLARVKVLALVATLKSVSTLGAILAISNALVTASAAVTGLTVAFVDISSKRYIAELEEASESTQVLARALDSMPLFFGKAVVAGEYWGRWLRGGGSASREFAVELDAVSTASARWADTARGTVTPAAKEIAEGLYESEQAAQEFAAAISKGLQEAAERMEELYESAAEDIGGLPDVFSGAGDLIDISLDEMMSNLEEKSGRQQRFVAGLAELYRLGLHNVASVFRDAGPDAVGALEKFLTEPLEERLAFEDGLAAAQHFANTVGPKMIVDAERHRIALGQRWEALGEYWVDQLAAGFNDGLNTIRIPVPNVGTVSNPNRDFPMFDNGGVVPGPLGSPQLILAHAGETVLPTHKQTMGAFGGDTVVTVHVAGSVVSERDLVEVVHRGLLSKQRVGPLGFA